MTETAFAETTTKFPAADPPGWKSKAKFHEAAFEFGRTKIRLRSTTGKVTVKFA